MWTKGDDEPTEKRERLLRREAEKGDKVRPQQNTVAFLFCDHFKSTFKIELAYFISYYYFNIHILSVYGQNLKTIWVLCHSWQHWPVPGTGWGKEVLLVVFELV